MEVMVVAARPLWNTPLVPLQLLVTAVAGAIGLVLVLERAMGIVRVADTRLLNQALAASQLAALAVGAIWLALGLFELSRATSGRWPRFQARPNGGSPRHGRQRPPC